MDGETLFVEQVLVAQGEEFSGIPQVGGVASCGKNCHHIVASVDQLNLFVDCGIAFFQISVNLVKFFCVAIVIDNGRIELRFCNAMFLKHRIDIILRFPFSLFCWQLINDALHDVVIIQHIFHLAT